MAGDGSGSIPPSAQSGSLAAAGSGQGSKVGAPHFRDGAATAFRCSRSAGRTYRGPSESGSGRPRSFRCRLLPDRLQRGCRRMDGPAPEHVTLDEALDIIRDLLREQFRLTGRLPKTVVTIGGTALAARGIRERSDDVDLYLSETEDASVLSVQDAYRRKYGPTFKIDVTPVNTLWGDIAVNDIEQSPIVATLEVQGRTVEIRALSPETMYLVKVAAYRPKDIPDLPLIATRCSSQSLIVRAKQMFPWYADRSAFPQYVERLAR